ncbi:hypothetical protein [Thiothrix lacustris]|uniref:hypothetical protein n=1 Tax=Thiothrix lacustris TaxID=525917 RepID=UPI0027E4F77B|nr:hypothetical protein [Thiothrix lacustris]WMP16592.1 hypothetical protein RCS87_14545 [Thiothrix lacustris]
MIKKINHASKITSIILALSVSAGCSMNATKSTITPEQEKDIQACKTNLPSSKKIKKEAVTYGCLASLAFWKAIGQENPAALMCVAGGGAGFVLGDSVAERKCSYLNIANQLDGEIAHTSKTNGTFALFFIEQDLNLKLQQAQAEALLTAKEKASADKVALQKMQESLTEQLEKEQYLLTQMQEERQFKQETVNKAKQAKLEKEKIDMLTNEIKSLIDNIKKLRENNKSLRDIKETFAANTQ